jgi:cell wall-associated NlpC family hydrolase
MTRRPFHRLSILAACAGIVLAVVLGAVGGTTFAGADGTDPGSGIDFGLGAFGSTSDFATPNIFPDTIAATGDLGVATLDATTLSEDDGLALAQSPYPLSQIDLTTGTVMGPAINSAISDDESTTLALASVGALAIDATTLNESAQIQQSQQQAQSSSGCPLDAPPNTLPSSVTNIEALCQASVAGARSSQAALAIKYALNNLGDPYSQALRNSVGYYDCSSFVSRAYQAAGVPIAPAGQNAPTTYTIANAPWAVHESWSAAQPGDLIEPDSGHVVILLADGYIAQAPMTGEVTDVTAVWWSEPYLSVWIDPSQA